MAFKELGHRLANDSSTRLSDPLTQVGQCPDLAVGKVDERTWVRGG